MSGYSEIYREMKADAFLEQWAPKGSWEHIEATPETLRWNIARARAAENQLQEVKKAVTVLRRLEKYVTP